MKDKISALMDGELDRIDVADTISQIKESEELRNEWSTYHLIGDVLRQPAMSPPDITLSIRNEVDIDPIALTPDIPKEKNNQIFAFAIAASMVAAVAAVTWMSGQTMERPLTDETSLQAVAPTVTTDPVLAQKEETKTEKLVLQDPASIRINDYMFVHGEFTAIRGVSPYMRTVARRP